MEVDCRHFVVDEPRKAYRRGVLSAPRRWQPSSRPPIGDGGTVAGRQAALSASRSAGFRAARRSADVSARGFASRASSGREMTRSSKKPLSQPATARWWPSEPSRPVFRARRQACGLFHVIAHRPTGISRAHPGWEHVARRQRCSAESAAPDPARTDRQSLMLQRLRQATACHDSCAADHCQVCPATKQSCRSEGCSRMLVEHARTTENAGMLGLSLASSQTSRAMLLHPRLGMTVPKQPDRARLIRHRLTTAMDNETASCWPTFATSTEGCP